MPVALSKVAHPGERTGLSKHRGGINITVRGEQPQPACSLIEVTHHKAEVGFCKSQAGRALCRQGQRRTEMGIVSAVENEV